MNTSFESSPEKRPYSFFLFNYTEFQYNAIFILPAATHGLPEIIYLYPLGQNKQVHEQKAASLATGHFASQHPSFQPFTDVHTIPPGFL